MKKIQFLGALMALVALAALASSPARAQSKREDMTDLQALRRAVQADKRAVVADTLDLTDAENRKFWPIYRTYQRALDAADRRRTRAIVAEVGRDRPFTDPYAKAFALELIAADEAEIKARRTLENKLMRALPPRKAARYLQLESKIRAVEAYEIAQALPLVK